MSQRLTLTSASQPSASQPSADQEPRPHPIAPEDNRAPAAAQRALEADDGGPAPAALAHRDWIQGHDLFNAKPIMSIIVAYFNPDYRVDGIFNYDPATALNMLYTQTSKVSRADLEIADRLDPEQTVGLPQVEKGAILEALDDEGLIQLLTRFKRRFPAIHFLNFVVFGVVRDKGIMALAETYPTLRNFSLGHFMHHAGGVIASAACLQFCASHLHSLTHLSLMAQNLIEDVGVQSITSQNPHLKSILLDNLYGVTDASLLTIAQSCPNLEEISLKDLKISAQGMEALLQGCPKLSKIKLDQLPLISTKQILTWQQEHPEIFFTFGEGFRLDPEDADESLS